MRPIPRGLRAFGQTLIASVTVPVLAAVTSSDPQVPVVQPDGDLNPIVALMPLSARLDYRLTYQNQTGAELNYLGGTLRFRDSEGSLLRTDALDPAGYAERSAFNSAAFINGRSVIDVVTVTSESVTDMVTSSDAKTWLVGTGKGANSGNVILLARINQDGRPDATFDGETLGNGIVTTPVAGASRGLALIPGGGLYVCGGTVGGLANPLVARFESTGARRLSFGGANSGSRSWSLGGFAIAEDVAVDNVDRPVVAGWASIAGVHRVFVSRLSTGGSLDDSFGAAGNAVLTIPGATGARAYSVALDSAGRIVFAGNVFINGAQHMLVGRLDDEGNPDPKFGGDGFVILSFGVNTTSHASKVLVTSGDRILLAGRVQDGEGDTRFALARLEDTGGLDVDFGTGGRVEIEFPGMEDASAVGLTQDLFGRIIVTGHASTGSQRQFAVARLKSTGALDTTFHQDGRRTIGGFGGGSTSSGVGAGVLYAGDVGDLIVAGFTSVPVDDPAKEDDARWALARLDFNGALNAGVGVPVGSKVTTDFLDAPFAPVDGEPPFVGFDPKAPPARVDVEFRYKEIAQPVTLNGAEPKVYERNTTTFRFPLKNPTGPATVQIRVNQSHHFGQNHVGNPAQRYALDLGMYDTERKSSRVPAAQLNLSALRTKWSSAPGFDLDVDYPVESFNEASLIYGAQVVAMAAGQVVFARDGDPENFPVGTRDTRSGGGGNSVIINHGNGEFSFYAHMIPGTIAVKMGDQVQAGALLGNVGNSGSSSGPHLHFHVMRVFPAAGSTNGHGPGVPMYFSNVRFATQDGGPVVRQLRTDLPQSTLFSVFENPVANTTPGAKAGPGNLGALVAGSSFTGAPLLVPPVQVTGSIAAGSGGEVADAGDVAERVYAFSVPETGNVQIRLSFPADHDLDFIVYDRNLTPRKPSLGKTRQSPELAQYLLNAGSYFVLVSRDDRMRGTAPSPFTLDIGFSALPQISGTLSPAPGGGRGFQMRFPLTLGTDGEPIALLLPAVQKVREAAARMQWEDVPVRPQIIRGEAIYDLPILPEGSELFRLVYPETPE